MSARQLETGRAGSFFYGLEPGFKGFELGKLFSLKQKIKLGLVAAVIINLLVPENIRLDGFWGRIKPCGFGAQAVIATKGL